jgi:hypothetical protein
MGRVLLGAHIMPDVTFFTTMKEPPTVIVDSRPKDPEEAHAPKGRETPFIREGVIITPLMLKNEEQQLSTEGPGGSTRLTPILESDH